MTNATDLGPLQLLIGTWRGSTGRDLAPEPDGTETNDYRETLIFKPVRPFSNAEEQRLEAIQYHQVVHRIRDNKQIHDQCGYFSWDAQTNRLLHSFSLPRGLCLIAGGMITREDDGTLTIEVTAEDGDADFPVAQASFLREKARTLSFSQTIVVKGSELHYKQSTVVDIYGKTFNHTDENRLTRVD